MTDKALTIRTLPIKVSERLTGDARTRLVKIVEQEFANKESLFHQVSEEEKRKAIEAYRKKVGFEKLQTEYEKIKAEERKIDERLKQIVGKVEELGLNINGEPASTTRYNTRTGNYEINYKAKELQKLLSTIEDNSPSMNLKNKLITRITLASTVGEASVIMREVLGNGLIPELNEKELKE